MMRAVRTKCVLVSFAVLFVGMLAVGQNRVAPSTDLGNAINSIRSERILEHVQRLASDKFEGRGPGTLGETLTVNYLTSQFKKAGLKPGNPDGTFVQKVPLVGYQTVPKIDIEIGGRIEALNFIEDFVHDFPALKPAASVKNAGVVFAGYGIVASQHGWDDYKDIDVRNKLVIVLSGEPSVPDKIDPKKSDPSVFRGDTRTYYSTREFKFDVAAKKGAAGILVVYDPEKAATYSLFQTFAKMEGFGLKPRSTTKTLISGLMTVGAARRIFSAAGQDFGKLQASAEQKSFKAIATPARANISIKSKIRNIVSRNVVARLEGTDPLLKNEFIIFSAHWDHLGKDTNLKGDQIYNGAIDDALGTSQLLGIAGAFANLPTKPKRSILLLPRRRKKKVISVHAITLKTHCFRLPEL